MFRPSSGRSFPFEPTVIALSSEAKLTPSSVSSELAGIIPNALTANIKLKTYLIDPLQPLTW
jgi:hypothetical protein